MKITIVYPDHQEEFTGSITTVKDGLKCIDEVFITVNQPPKWITMQHEIDRLNKELIYTRKKADIAIEYVKNVEDIINKL